jgi:hypothetical protein
VASEHPRPTHAGGHVPRPDPLHLPQPEEVRVTKPIPPVDTKGEPELHQLSPETEALAAMPLPELERELKHVVAGSRIPPSQVKRIFEAYELMRRGTPDAQRETTCRNYLVQLISGYRQPGIRKQEGEDLSLAALRKIFLTMETKNQLSLEQRQQIMKASEEGYNQPNISEEDRDWYKRLTLAGQIRNLAADPHILGKSP